MPRIGSPSPFIAERPPISAKTMVWGALAVSAIALGAKILNSGATSLASLVDGSNPDSGLTDRGIEPLQKKTIDLVAMVIDAAMLIGIAMPFIYKYSLSSPPVRNQDSLQHFLSMGSGKDLNTLLDEVFYYSNQPRSALDQLIDYPDPDNHLRQFLDKLSETIDYKEGGQWRKALAQKVVEYLKFAQENASYRDRFFVLIDRAGVRCGDRG